ncbi:retropepsin-like aspartic protease [Aquabacterium lacunae]
MTMVLGRLAVWALLVGLIGSADLTHGQGAGGAHSVAMTGAMGNKALLVIAGSAPKALAAGDSHQGVKVLSVAGDSAVVEVAGQRQTIRLGGAPVSLGDQPGQGGARGERIVLTSGSGGHFTTAGSINGKAVRFMVDTGATSVAMGAAEARRLGIDYEKGQRGMAHTANGSVHTYRVKLDRVRIQDVEVFNVDATVMPSNMSEILLGNSFLNRFQMQKAADQLTLIRRF